jgi:hypothetical protein
MNRAVREAMEPAAAAAAERWQQEAVPPPLSFSRPSVSSMFKGDWWLDLNSFAASHQQELLLLLLLCLAPVLLIAGYASIRMMIDIGRRDALIAQQQERLQLQRRQQLQQEAQAAQQLLSAEDAAGDVREVERDGASRHGDAGQSRHRRGGGGGGRGGGEAGAGREGKVAAASGAASPLSASAQPSYRTFTARRTDR